MSHPILVRHITHLTDARYFAAMGVDWISMKLDADPKSFMRWHSIRDWVEGVKLLAEPASGDEELLARVIIDAKPDGILLPEGVEFEVPEGIVRFKVGMDFSDPLPYFDELSTSPIEGAMILAGPLPPEEGAMIYSDFPEEGVMVFLEAEWTLEKIQEVLSSGYRGGFCFYGGQEDAIGVRDYEEMDEMIEAIRR